MAKWIRTLPTLLGVDWTEVPSCVTAPSSSVAQGLAIPLAGLLCLLPVDAGAQQRGSTTDVVGPECADCEIVSVPLVSLGDPEGLGMLESDYNIVRVDRRGRYFVSGGLRPYFWVFDSSGKVTHRIGRHGEGPGEFSRIMDLAIDAADSVFVFDHSLHRVTVYTPDLEFARTFPLRFRLDGSALFVGASLLVNTGIHTEDRVGQPLHLLDRDGRIERSFGSVTGGVYRADLQDVIDRRQLAQSTEASFWAVRINQLLIERWATDGRLLGTLHWEPPWFRVWWQPQADAETPPVTSVIALEQVADTLWVLVAVPGERWRSAIEPDGRLYRVTDLGEYQNAALAAIDVRRGVAIASRRMPRLLQGLTEGGLAFNTEADTFGNPVVRVYRLEIHSPSTQGG